MLDSYKQPYLFNFLIEKSFIAGLTVVGKLQCSATPQLKILWLLIFDGKIVLSIKEQMPTAIVVLDAHASETYLLEKAIHNMNSASSEENSIIQASICLQQKGPPHTHPFIFFSFVQLYMFYNLFLLHELLCCSDHFLFTRCLKQQTFKQFII